MKKEHRRKLKHLKKWIAEKGENKPFEKESIGKAAKWLVNNAKEIGIDIKGFEHEVTNYFIENCFRIWKKRLIKNKDSWSPSYWRQSQLCTG
jgi:hypothetical protein